jgi:3-oxoacyl-[acyl-carrier protein] reductase
MIIKKILIYIYVWIHKIFKKKQQHIIANIAKLSENELLLGRCALITGGTSGIGYAIADAFLDAGAEYVIITGRTEERCRKAVEKLNNCNKHHKGKALYKILNMKDVNTFEQKFQEIQKIIYPSKISILCNNAGIQGGIFGRTTEDDFNNVMDTNFKGTYFLSQLIAKYMIKNEIDGNIINIASSSSIRPTNSVYSLSKACIKEFTAGIAKYLLPYGIIVNGIAPGPTATPLMNKDNESYIEHPTNPSRRYAVPEEIANMVVFLASSMGRMIVGDIIYMTGGSGIITYDDCKYDI